MVCVTYIRIMGNMHRALFFCRDYTHGRVVYGVQQGLNNKCLLGLSSVIIITRITVHDFILRELDISLRRYVCVQYNNLASANAVKRSNLKLFNSLVESRKNFIFNVR